MKRTLLCTTLAFALHGAMAADTKTAASAQAHADARVDANVTNDVEAKTTAARKEFDDLRAQMQSLSRRMADLSAQLGDVGPRAYAYRYVSQPDRAMVGIVLAADKDGARISAVTPDGPAARAGLRNGDVITAIDGQPWPAGEEKNVLSQARERLANLKENQNVHIDYMRGTTRGSVVVEAQRREARNWPALIAEDPAHPFLPKDFNERVQADVDRAMRDSEHALRDKDLALVAASRAHADSARATHDQVRAARAQARAGLHRGMPWWGINLSPVDADLGRYFGVTSGALVLSTDPESLKGLRAGDVITAVGSDKVTRPEDVMRALRDQPVGKDVELKLMRDRKPLALNMKTPAFKSIFGAPPMPPVPPMPATPPMPPTPATPPLPASAPSPNVGVSSAARVAAAVAATAALPATAADPAAQQTGDD
ncbi:MAG: PDZ domain-containing protein [Dokdonella sp.]|uniref:PDZ domain-containing protein n=1 Tax=Dokdonella sp. TaxID=2291710 RepID=UPI003263103D